MTDREGFTFQGTGKLARIDRFPTKSGKTIITLIFEFGGQYPTVVPIKIFGRLAEGADELQPGDILEVEGRLGGRDWNGKVYGDNVATSIDFISGGSSQQTETGSRRDEPPPPSDDDVPF